MKEKVIVIMVILVLAFLLFANIGGDDSLTIHIFKSENEEEPVNWSEYRGVNLEKEPPQIIEDEN